MQNYTLQGEVKSKSTFMLICEEIEPNLIKMKDITTSKQWKINNVEFEVDKIKILNEMTDRGYFNFMLMLWDKCVKQISFRNNGQLESDKIIKWINRVNNLIQIDPQTYFWKYSPSKNKTQ